MANRIEIFCTKEDALQLFGEIEAARPLWYVKEGIYSTPACQTYRSVTQIPQLGTTPRSSRTASDTYMIFPNQVDVAFRDVKQNAGHTLYMLDPWKDPPCILFTCGGIYDGDPKGQKCLIAGLVETAYKDSEVAGLFSVLSKVIKKNYRRFQRPGLESFVGPKAVTLFRSGWRLTESCSSPPELDRVCESGES